MPSKLKLRGSSTLFAEAGVTGREVDAVGVRDAVCDDVFEREGVEEEGGAGDREGVTGAGDAFKLLRERVEESGVEVVEEEEEEEEGVKGGVSTSMAEMQFFKRAEMDCGWEEIRRGCERNKRNVRWRGRKDR